MIDALGKKGLSPLQKSTTDMCMSVSGVTADVVDCVKTGESTSNDCLKKFVTDVVLLFEDEYLHKPNSYDLEHLLKMGESCDFLGMLGSTECMHWQWKISESMERNVHERS